MNSYLWIRLDLEPAVTKMAFTPERKDWCRVVIPDLLLFGIVSHTHSNVVVACTTVGRYYDDD